MQLVIPCDLHPSECICMVWPESAMHDRGGTGRRDLCVVLSRALCHYIITLSYFNLHN